MCKVDVMPTQAVDKDSNGLVEIKVIGERCKDAKTGWIKRLDVFGKGKVGKIKAKKKNVCLADMCIV